MYMFEDFRDFADEYPTKEEKEAVLAELSDEEIWHLAQTCGNHTGAAWISSHMKDPNHRYEKRER